jgi:hypothetical protein
MAFQELLKVNKNIKDIQNLIDDNKEFLRNDVYLNICEKMKTIYHNSNISEKIYNFTYIKTYVDVVPNIDGTINYNLKNKLLTQIAFYNDSIDDLENMIKPCNRRYLDNYIFERNDNGLTELIKVFSKNKKIFEKDEDEEESYVKININLDYNDILIVGFSKIKMEEILLTSI